MADLEQERRATSLSAGGLRSESAAGRRLPRRFCRGGEKAALSENLEDTPFSLGFRGLERQG
jgi:hypothetical protein